MRHVWVSSPVQNRQAEGRRELESLFDRLVELLGALELTGVGPSANGPGSFTGRFRAFAASAVVQRPIRITPSFLGRALSKKAIPYYYDPTDLAGDLELPAHAAGAGDGEFRFRRSGLERDRRLRASATGVRSRAAQLPADRGGRGAGLPGGLPPRYNGKFRPTACRSTWWPCARVT